MRKKFLIALTIILVLCTACTLFACSNSSSSVDQRSKAIENFQNAYLKACSDNWSLYLTADEQKALYNEGHYVYQKEWAAFYADVLKSSSIRIQKITAINEQLLYNEDLKKLIREGKFNYKNLTGLFDDAGLIAEDISELIFILADKFIKEGYNTAEIIYDKVSALYDKAAESAQTTANKLNKLKEVKLEAEYLTQNIKNIEDNKASLSADLNSVRTSVQSVIVFAYDFIDTVDELQQLDFDSALTPTQAEEIAVFINGVILSVEELGAQFDSETVKTVGQALSNLSAAFEDIYLEGDVLVSTIDSALRYVNLGLDFLPLACDIVSVAGGAIDVDFIKKYSEINDYPQENYALLLGKLFNELTETISQNSVYARFDEISESSGDNLQKIALSSFIIQSVFSLPISVLPNDISYYLSEDDGARMQALITYQLVKKSNLVTAEKFARNYAVNQNTSINSILNNITWAKSCLAFLDDPILNPNGVTPSVDIVSLEDGYDNPRPECVKEWFTAISDAVDEMFAEIVQEINDSVFNAAKLMIGDFYSNGEIYAQLANFYDTFGLISADSEHFAELARLYAESGIDDIVNSIK